MKRLGDGQYLLTVQNSITSFSIVTFLTFGSVCLEFFRTVTSKTMLNPLVPGFH